jgi:Hg(II)-responsive transcriptional regulator
MRSSEVAKEAGVNVQTLRYYERRGILPQPERLDSGYRAYGTDAVRIVRFVRRTQQLGFSLEEIESLLDLANGGPNNCDAAKRMAQEKLAQLDEKIAILRAMRESLTRLVQTCELSRPRRECPLLDTMETGVEQRRFHDA